MVPHFADPCIAIVQSPQDYRDDSERLFKQLCHAEYQGFFHIGMVTRNDRDAIIQHGTMTLVRRQVLDRLGWAQWCICEDAELGLRVFEAGLSAAYHRHSYGKGLMPDTFSAFKKQRSRWAYGAVQILKRHAGPLLLGRGSQLSRGQRYHFVAGWLPWIADGMNIFFTFGALLWSGAMIIVPRQVEPPLLVFAIPPLALFTFKVGKMLFLYRRAMGVPLGQALGAAVAGLALSHTIGKAVLSGLFTRSMPFVRTPKLARKARLLQALAEAREELYVLLLLWGAAAGVCLTQGLPNSDARWWVILLLVQALPYLAAVALALVSAAPQRRQAAKVALRDA
jgi:cellulose synthase/poly-beta-1,6-N-acetylglucosamine synthase-like glycosyltransferase